MLNTFLSILVAARGGFILSNFEDRDDLPDTPSIILSFADHRDSRICVKKSAEFKVCFSGNGCLSSVLKCQWIELRKTLFWSH